MKKIARALADDVHYPIGDGFIENVLIKRGIGADLEITTEIMNSDEYKGALADCLYSLIQSINFSEADKTIGSLTDKDKERILLRVNKLYKEIGEEEVEIEKTPKVQFL